MSRWMKALTLNLFFPAVAALAADGSLGTRVTMMVGFPGDGIEPASVLVVPGAVIPVAAETGRDRARIDEAAERADLVRDLTEKLRRAVGLASVEVAYVDNYSLKPGLPSPLGESSPSFPIRGELTLLAFNDEIATFRAEFRRGAEILVDSEIAVERGGRAVVGGLDGEEAPYFFVVLEPSSRAEPAGEAFTEPRKLVSVMPDYPADAREQRVEGVVRLRAMISEQGEVEEIEVVQGLEGGFTEAALAALRQWTFEPATLEGEPIAVYFDLTFRFRLSKDGT